MDYDEFGTQKTQHAKYTDDNEEPNPPAGRGQVTVSLSWQQIAFILGVNAIISLIISLLVVIIAGPNVPSRPTTARVPEAAVQETKPSPMVDSGGETSQTQPSVLEPPSTPASGDGSTAAPGSGEAPPEETSVEPTNYTVQPGDTLGSVATRFDVSLDDLMQANGITNPDYVQVGQELLIPIGGLPRATPTFTPVPIPTDTPLPFNPPTPLPSGTAPPAEPAATIGPTPTPVPTLASASGNEIRLVLQVLNPGEPGNEMVQIVNQGAFVRLTGWTLSDEAGTAYTFPDFSLWGGGAVNIHTSGGSNTTTDLYWGRPNPVWEVGSTVMLKNAGGEVLVALVVPEQ